MRIEQDFFRMNSINNQFDINNDKNSTFEKFYKSALSAVEQVNLYQKSADVLQMDFAAGKTDDMLSVMLAQEKAYTSLNFTVQVTNRVLESYREIMRMQI